MSSGEWDLRALKALEEEEQKEFLALSQKSLFDPPSPPTAGKLLQQTQLLKQQHQQLHQQQPKLTYAQLHPHILKLPTINECNLIAAARRRELQLQKERNAVGSNGSGSKRLKFTRALSLSAHSLTTRGNNASGKKTDSNFKLSAPKSSGSLSPPQPYSVSPVYTPPPARRCATLHHTQPVRKAFKTLQQLEKQKQERKKEITATLHRVTGTNKTYWKYGVNSTAASIIGQRTLKRKKLSASVTELASNTSDEVGSEEISASINNNCTSNISQPNEKRRESPLKFYTDYDDSDTETGSCTVPITNDSVEMMRLMLTAATAAVTTKTATAATKFMPENFDFFSNTQPLGVPATTATNGPSRKISTIPILDAIPFRQANKFCNNISKNKSNIYGTTFRTLSSRYPSFKLPASTFTPQEESVAYEAFHELTRRKSFSSDNSRTAPVLLRGNSLTEEPTTSDSNSQETPIAITISTTARAANGRKILKASSLDTATDFEYLYLNGTKNEGSSVQRTTIITNPIVEGIKAATPPVNKTKTTNHVSSSLRPTKTPFVSTSVTTTGPCKGMDAILHYNVDKFNKASLQPHAQDQRRQNALHQSNLSEEQQQHQHIAAMQCQQIASPTNSISPSLPSGHQQHIDNELEEHIKHCSCSCNHMGYGNSMDYQTTGFGGLPDVTEHSNIRRTLSRQNSSSNSDSGGEVSSIQKCKPCYGDGKLPAVAHTRSVKRKSKTARQVAGDSCVTAHRYKTRRGSCAVALTMVAALCLCAIVATLVYQQFFMAPSRNSHAQRLQIIRRILHEVPLVDGHNNLAWNVRKYAHNSLDFIHLNDKVDQNSLQTRPAWSQTDMERLKQGLIGVQMWSAYVPCAAQGLDAVQLALEQIDIIHRLVDMYKQDTILVKSFKDIAAARLRGQMASLIGIEGGHAIGSSLGVLRSFYSVGARSLSLTHKCDVSWAGSSTSASVQEYGLTQFGKAIIREMNRLGMMIDLTYSSDITARDVLQITRAPVIFSHSGARQLCNSSRNVPDDILRLLAENGGLIMISFDSEDITCTQRARLADVVEHIKHIRAIAGVQHIGLGAGYDGIEFPPIGLEDVTKYPHLLATLLEDHNWSEEDIAMLAGKNFLRIMETVENVRDYWKRAAIQPIEQTEPQPKSQCTYMTT